MTLGMRFGPMIFICRCFFPKLPFFLDGLREVLIYQSKDIRNDILRIRFVKLGLLFVDFVASEVWGVRCGWLLVERIFEHWQFEYKFIG